MGKDHADVFAAGYACVPGAVLAESEAEAGTFLDFRLKGVMK